MTVPGYGKPSAMGMNLYGAVQQAAPYAGHHSGAGAGAAGQGFAGPTFVNTQLDGVAVDDLHETGIDALREARMRLDDGAPSCDGRGVGIGHDLHRPEERRVGKEGVSTGRSRW